jgi:Tfp pilus assembly protein PilX
MRSRTGWFPYVLATVWAALVVLALIDMAGFSATVVQQRAPAKATVAPQRPTAKAARALDGRPTPRNM